MSSDEAPCGNKPANVTGTWACPRDWTCIFHSVPPTAIALTCCQKNMGCGAMAPIACDARLTDTARPDGFPGSYRTNQTASIALEKCGAGNCCPPGYECKDGTGCWVILQNLIDSPLSPDVQLSTTATATTTSASQMPTRYCPRPNGQCTGRPPWVPPTPSAGTNSTSQGTGSGANTTTSSSSSSSNNNNTSDFSSSSAAVNLSPGAIAGIVIGAIAGTLLLLLAAYYYRQNCPFQRLVKKLVKQVIVQIEESKAQKNDSNDNGNSGSHWDESTRANSTTINGGAAYAHYGDQPDGGQLRRAELHTPIHTQDLKQELDSEQGKTELQAETWPAPYHYELDGFNPMELPATSPSNLSSTYHDVSSPGTEVPITASSCRQTPVWYHAVQEEETVIPSPPWDGNKGVTSGQEARGGV